MLNCAETAAILREWDKILVLSHASPDGDTLGSACALLRGLTALGKQAAFLCADPIPEKYHSLFEGLSLEGFSPEHVMTVDVADRVLLGTLPEETLERIELAIDHHRTHVPFAENRWVDPKSAATTEMIWELLEELSVEIDAPMASCIYTGLTTDTGCFRYANVTARTHRIAARMLECGADGAKINRLMFESKSRAQVKAERMVLDTMDFFCEGKCAIVEIPRCICEKTGATEDELDALVSLPRQIEGVILGLTLKEKDDGVIKASLRVNPPADAAAFCAQFGGGGHKGAAGCSLGKCSLAEAKAKLVTACESYLKELEL